MLKITYETPACTTFLISQFVHGNNDSYRQIELDESGRETLDHKDHMAMHYMGYEVEVIYRMDLVTHKATPIAVETDGKWFGQELTDVELTAARRNGSS